MRRRSKRKTTTKTLSTIGLAVWLTLFAIGSHAGGKDKPIDVNVFVTTATDAQGFVDAESQQRVASVADLKKQLAKRMHVVDSADAADIVVTLTDAVYDSDNDVRLLHVELHSGDYTTKILGGDWPITIFSVRGWSAAAFNAAYQIEQWVKMNHDALLAQRASKQKDKATKP